MVSAKSKLAICARWAGSHTVIILINSLIVASTGIELDGYRVVVSSRESSMALSIVCLEVRVALALTGMGMDASVDGRVVLGIISGEPPFRLE